MAINQGESRIYFNLDIYNPHGNKLDIPAELTSVSSFPYLSSMQTGDYDLAVVRFQLSTQGIPDADLPRIRSFFLTTVHIPISQEWQGTGTVPSFSEVAIPQFPHPLIRTSGVIYEPHFLRKYSMKSQALLNILDVKVWYRFEDGSAYPLMVEPFQLGYESDPFGCACSIKIALIRKDIPLA